MAIRSSILAWLAPGGLILIAATVWVLSVPEPSVFQRLVDGYGYAMYAFGFLLAWRFQRSRVAVGLLGIAVLDVAIEGGSSSNYFQAASLAVPAALLLLGPIQDRGVLSPIGLAQQALLGTFFLGLVAASAADPAQLAKLLEYRFIRPDLLAWTPLTQPVLLVWILALTTLALLARIRRKPVELGLFWGLAAALVALHVRPAPVAALYLATAGLILTVSVVEHSYALAHIDELTGLPGRRAFWKAVPGAGNRYVIAVVEIDHFKKFNDRHGHDVGDQVLRMVASRLRTIAGGARSFRFGGEEFAVLFPGLTAAEALPHLERFCGTLAAHRFTIRSLVRPKDKPEGPLPKQRRSSKSYRVTVSIGLAEPSGRRTRAARVLKYADKALYRAKRAGRNRVKV